MKYIKAKGREKHLLRVIGELQSKIGFAEQLHYNDRNRESFSRAQALLADAFDLCIQTTSIYDPASYDESYEFPND